MKAANEHIGLIEQGARRDQRMIELIAAQKIARPDHPALANMYRRAGNLPAAAAEYQRLRKNGLVSPELELFHAIFQQQRAPERYPDTAFAPAPFVHIDQYLARADNQSLLVHTIARHADFRLTELNKLDPYGKHGRTNLVNYDVGAAGESMRALVEEQLPCLCERLNLPPIALKFIHLKLAAYQDGDFFHAHQDNGHQHPERKISFVYYFNLEPKPYQGGDLILYDTRLAPAAYVRSMYTRIVPHNNGMIFFPSEFFHEVLPVKLASSAFSAGRFTMAGHIG